MADFLTAVSTKKVKSPEPLLQDIKSLQVQDVVEVNSASSALEALKNQPSRETIANALNYMTSDGFSLLLPEPLNASIAYQLVNDTVPHYWRPLKGSSQRKLFARILQNPLGVGHVITRLRSLVVDSRQKKAPGNARDPAEHIEELLELLEAILHGDDNCSQVLRDIQAYGKNSTQKKLLWREYLAQAVSGRLIAIVAEAEDVLKTQKTSWTASWIADGCAYAEWLGRNMAALIREEVMREEQASATLELCSKALSLGYTGKRPAFADLKIVD
jgi:telomere length regulation protein